jgi:penicillin-binding protein 1A
MALALGARRVLRSVRRFVRFSLAFGLIVGVLAGVAATGVGIYYYQNVAADLPDVALIRKHKPSLVSRVFDQSGSLLREFYVEKRFLVTLDQIPDVVIQAILATEDARFEEHPGVDLVGIGRAAIKNLFDWGVVEGGSTITQQLAKSLFLSPERSIDRKIREAILAIRIEQTYSKREILNFYLNQIYFGEGAYGIEAASRVYFGKNAESLTLPEAALLAGLPRAPSSYSPFKFYRRALRRRAHVLRRMIEENFITPGEWAEAEVTPIRLVKKLRGRARPIMPSSMSGGGPSGCSARRSSTGEASRFTPLSAVRCSATPSTRSGRGLWLSIAAADTGAPSGRWI